MSLHLCIKEFPPSINKLYFNHPRGGKSVTTAGKAFQRRILYQIQQEHGPELVQFKPNDPYDLTIEMYFPEIYNKGWPKTAQQRFKRRDADNLLKLLLDTLSRAIGVDDANFLRFTVVKRRDPENPRIEVTIAPYQEAP